MFPFPALVQVLIIFICILHPAQKESRHYTYTCSWHFPSFPHHDQPFVYSFTQQTCVKHLPCSRCCSRHLRHISKRKRQNRDSCSGKAHMHINRLNHMLYGEKLHKKEGRAGKAGSECRLIGDAF